MLKDEPESPMMGEKSMDGLNSCMERGARGVRPPPRVTKKPLETVRRPPVKIRKPGYIPM